MRWRWLRSVWGKSQLACDGHGVAAIREEFEDATFLVRERLDRGVVGVIGERND